MDSDYDLVKSLSYIVNTQAKNASTTSLISCLEMYVKVLGNIDAHPGEEKYRKFKAKAKPIENAFGSISGGWDLLLKIGWVKKVHEFEEWFFWNGKEGDLKTALAWAKERLELTQEKSKNAASSAEAAKKKEEEYQQNLLKAVDQERGERYRKQYGSS